MISGNKVDLLIVDDVNHDYKLDLDRTGHATVIKATLDSVLDHLPSVDILESCTRDTEAFVLCHPDGRRICFIKARDVVKLKELAGQTKDQKEPS